MLLVACLLVRSIKCPSRKIGFACSGFCVVDFFLFVFVKFSLFAFEWLHSAMVSASFPVVSVSDYKIEV